MKKLFRANVGGIDKTARLVIGLALLAVGIFTSSTILWAIGLVLMFTSVLEWCPPYALFGFSSCPKN